MLSEAPFRNIVLLGAGASMAGGLPAATGLTNHLLAARNALGLAAPPSAVQLLDQDIAWLKDIQSRLGDIRRHLRDFNPENIEDIFRVWGYERGQAKIQMPDAPPNLISGYQYPRLIRMLALALAYSPRHQSAGELKQPNIYSWLIDRLVDTVKPDGQGGCAPVIVTTNYDLLIEFAISAIPDVDLTYSYNEYGDLRNIFCREESARRTLHYLKLHGSINWWGERPGLRVSREAVLSMITSTSPLAAVAERYASAGEDIEMVPPATLKDVIYRAIWSDVWDEAFSAFCMCRHLVIIGYSFSQGDVLVHNTMTLGLARSPYLKSIVVIDPKANEVIHRIKSYFSDEFNSNKKWIGYEKKFDEKVSQWAPRNLFYGES